MNSLLSLAGEARPATEPALVATPAQSPAHDEAAQLAQDFASALAALSAGEPGLAAPAPAVATEGDASAERLQADLRDLLRALEQSLPAAQPMAAAETAESSDTTQPADMPAMDGLLQLLQPQLAAQLPIPATAVTATPAPTGTAAETAEPSGLPTAPSDLLPAAAPVAAPTSAGPRAASAPALVQAQADTADGAQPAAEPKPATARIEQAFGAALAHRAKADGEPGEGSAASDAASGPAAPVSPAATATSAVSSPSATPQLRAAAAVGQTPLQLGDTPPRQWQQPLMQALGDRLQLQIAARSEQAVIRLEPPLLGRVEIAIQHQAGDLQVRLSASHPEVTRQLQHISEGLRLDLAQRQSGEVSVQVSPRGLGESGGQMDSSQGQRRQAEAEDRRPGRALGEDGETQGPGFAQGLSAGA